MDPTIGVPVLICAVAVTIVSVLAFGLVPAMQATTSVGSALKESSSTVTASPRRARVRQALVAAQVALRWPHPDPRAHARDRGRGA
jgi:hypothetical protein